MCRDRTACVARTSAQGHYGGCRLDRMVPAPDTVHNIHGDGAADWCRIRLGYVILKTATCAGGRLTIVWSGRWCDTAKQPFAAGRSGSAICLWTPVLPVREARPG